MYLLILSPVIKITAAVATAVGRPSTRMIGARSDDTDGNFESYEFENETEARRAAARVSALSLGLTVEVRPSRQGTRP